MFLVKNIVEINNELAIFGEKIITVGTEMRILDIYSGGEGYVGFTLEYEHTVERDDDDDFFSSGDLCCLSSNEITTI